MCAYDSTSAEGSGQENLQALGEGKYSFQMRGWQVTRHTAKWTPKRHGHTKRTLARILSTFYPEVI